MSAALGPVTVTIWGTALGGGDVETVCTTKFMGHTLGFRGRQQDPRESIVWMHEDEGHSQPANSYALRVQGIFSRMGMVTGGIFRSAQLIVAPGELTDDEFRAVAELVDDACTSVGSVWAPASIRTAALDLPGVALNGMSEQELSGLAPRLGWSARAEVTDEHISDGVDLGPSKIRWSETGDMTQAVTIPAHAYLLSTEIPAWLRERAASLPSTSADVDPDAGSP